MPPRVLQVPLALVPTPQPIEIHENVDDAGEKVAQMLVTWPMATVMIEVDEESGRALAKRLNEIFGPGLHIAREMPGGDNGRGPT